MNKTISAHSLDRTVSACAWLIDVAQHSVDHHGWDPVIVRYLESLGQAAHVSMQRSDGGMGAVAPMKRSATDVKDYASLPAGRVTIRSHVVDSAARPDKQNDDGIPAMPDNA